MTTTQALAAVKRAAKRRDAAASDLSAALRAAREAGATLEQIGDAAGVSRQRIHQLLQNGGER